MFPFAFTTSVKILQAYLPKACWACGSSAMPIKLVYEECFKEESRDKVAESQQVKEYTRRVVAKGLEEDSVKALSSKGPSASAEM